MSQDDVQRSLGRIEGQLKQIIAEQKAMRDDFGAHLNDDQTQISAIRTDYTKKCADLKEDADRAKGAGWIVLGLLSALATFVGGAVIAALSGVVKFH